MIKGLSEVYDVNLLKDRQDIHTITSSLGYDDLVVIYRNKSALFTPTLVKRFYHHVIGLDQSTEASFAAYFSSLLRNQEERHWSPTTPKYTIISSACHIYNSFMNYDVVIEVDTKGIKKSFSSRDPKFNLVLDQETTKQIYLSSALRYFRGYSVLTHYLFDSSFWNDLSVYVIHELSLTYDDFIYIANNHPLVNELEYSLAHGMIQCLTLEQICDYIEQFDYKLPKLMTCFIEMVHSQEKIMKEIKPLIIKHLSRYADDIECTYYYIKYLIKKFDLATIQQYIPLMYSTIGQNPLSSIACALYNIAVDNKKEALIHLNLAGFCKNWPQKPMTKSENQYTKPDETLPFTITDNELSLYRSPLSGPFHEYFEALSMLASNTGIKYFSNSIQEFCEGKVEQNQENVPIYYPNFHFHKTTFIEELELFDPGVSGVPAVNELSECNITTIFKEYSKYVVKCFQHRNNLISSISPRHYSSKDLRLAVKLGDPQLYKVISKEICKFNVSSNDKLVMLKALELGLDKNWDAILNLQVYSNTQNEKNAVDQMIPYIAGLKRLCSQ